MRKIIEANPDDAYRATKRRLRENKKRQIESIDKQAKASKDRIRTQYHNKIEMINKQMSR